MSRNIVELAYPLALFVLVGFCFQTAHSLNYNKEITLTLKEKEALNEIKKLMIPKIPKSSFVYKFAKDDLYFLKWLSANDFNIRKAEKQIINHLAWRETEKIDSIDKEDWENFIKEYPIFFGNWDKQGRPVGEIWFSEWKTRDAVISGNLPKIIRLFAYLMEIQMRQLFEARSKGSNATQATFLADLEGANIIQQICPACLPAYLAMTQIAETHYPDLYSELYLVNMPPPFEIIVRLVKNILRPSIRHILKTYVNKSQWLPLLDKAIDKDQRSERFGGTIVRD